MSSPHHSPYGSPSNEDGINTKLILGVGVVSLVVFAISAVIAYVILKTDTAALQKEGVGAAPAAIGQAEIGIVDQVVFTADRRVEEWRAAQKQRLSTYGWVDKSKRLIHIPIEQAMRQVAVAAETGKRAPAAPRKGAATTPAGTESVPAEKEQAR